MRPHVDPTRPPCDPHVHVTSRAVRQLLYKMHASQPSTFTDVTKGDNKCTESGCFASCKGYEATKGWDPVTGLGTPKYNEVRRPNMAHLVLICTRHPNMAHVTLIWPGHAKVQ
eukprot:6965172-Prymnesium_polylepis.3